MHFKIRKDDQIMIKVGREKGKTGKVARVIPDKGMVVIEKLNMVRRHQKPSQKNKQGGIVEKEAPMSISNVMIICEKCKGPVRVGTKKLDDGKSVRYCKKCSEVIDK
ncbi:50S ribosomal protein L24 [bacterium]|nr:MAG: 50S ribosomal protein L24 [bacterium]